MTGLIMLLLANGQLAGCEPRLWSEGPPALIVQVVDPNWEPVPGAHVSVIRETDVKNQKTVAASEVGYAEFHLVRASGYSIEVRYPGFRNARVKNVYLAGTTAYIQVRLRLDPSPAVTVK